MHLYIHANDADRLRIVVFSYLWYIFVYTGGENMDLSYRAQIMSKDVAVATVAGNAVTPVREDLLPLFFKRSSSFEGWLRTRAIDIHRTNSRLLKKALRLAERDETELVLSVYAATITDTYWVKPEGSSLAYSDVKFTENYFDDVALTGGGVSEIALLYRNSEDKASMAHTPELTNTGSFEKCWRLIGGEWWMYKRADRLALFSELFVYELGTALGFPMAYYERVDGSTIRSRDFTGGAGVNFEPAASIVGDDDDYGVSYAAFRKLGTEFSDAYLEIIFLDAVCENVDRHTNNYGVLRDVVSGKILSLAPNYDNNLALVSRGYPNRADRTGLLQVLLFIRGDDTMGYQESLIYIQPQEQVGQIVKEYFMARQQDPSGRFLADIPAAVRLQAPLKGCPAGSVLLWAAGARSNNMLQAAMPDDWRLPGFCTVRTIPVEDIQHLLDHAVRDGIENELLAYNRSFKYMPLDLYFVEYVSMRERRKTNREKGGGGPER